MSWFNPDIHHRKSTRLRGHDYASAGWYYVTVCLDDIRCMLARKAINRLELTKLGRIADEYWREIPAHFPHAKLDKYEIMPDHMHGILQLVKRHIDNSDECDFCRGVQLNAPTTGQTIHQNAENNRHRQISPKKGSLSVIIRTWKGAVKTWAKNNGSRQFKWQRGFHDHIIRNAEELDRIRRYIEDNPRKLLLGTHNDDGFLDGLMQ